MSAMSIAYIVLGIASIAVLAGGSVLRSRRLREYRRRLAEETDPDRDGEVR